MCHFAALAVAFGLPLAVPTAASAQTAPVLESPVPFDSAGRVLVVTPTVVSRLGLVSPAWPVTDAFREARVYRTGADSSYVLVVQRVDGNVARYALSVSSFVTLRDAVARAIVAQGPRGERFIGTVTPSGTPGGTGIEVSQPAGNAFVRNQTLLGLAAYGPASAALFSDVSGPAAGGAYFVAAGTSFFVAANIARHRSVTRAQASRAAHGGTRGALTGLGVAAVAGANDAPARGGAVLAGAIGGTIVGFQQARGLSDGEAASAGLFADLGALTLGGIGGATGAFNTRRTVVTQETGNPAFPTFTYTVTDNSLTAAGKATIGAAIAAQSLGYVFGPRYARRAAYNVTAGDADMVLTSGVLGAVAAGAIAGEKANTPAVWGASAAGLVAGAWLADRGFVRKRDRTSAEGTLARLGALAGALMGGGVAAVAEADGRVAFGLASVGGVLGLIAADNIIAPEADAGPLRGILRTGTVKSEQRFHLTVGPVTSMRFTF